MNKCWPNCELFNEMQFFFNLQATGSTLKRKSPGRPRTVRTLNNVASVGASTQQSRKRSARKHSIALGISIRSLRRILHADLKLHPYKMMMVQGKGFPTSSSNS